MSKRRRITRQRPRDHHWQRTECPKCNSMTCQCGVWHDVLSTQDVIKWMGLTPSMTELPEDKA